MLFEFETNIYDKTPNVELFDIDEGFTKGNMFRELYEPYKNYNPKELKPQNEREMLLNNILKLSFALNDLNLYLDIYPTDMECYEIFKKYAMAYEKCLEEYERKYQVLEVDHDIYGKYSWLQKPWPWEDRYV